MIHILTTGGTIEGLDYDEDKNMPQDDRVGIESFLEAANISVACTTDQVFSKDSRYITLEDRKLLASRITASKANKVLVTHGTITMAETARYLGKLNLEKTIVLVGSFALGTDKNTDAPFNLGFAICALQTLEKGVYIAMNGRVFSWDNVTKNIDKNRFEENVD